MGRLWLVGEPPLAVAVAAVVVGDDEALLRSICADTAGCTLAKVWTAATGAVFGTLAVTAAGGVGALRTTWLQLVVRWSTRDGAAVAEP